MAGDSLQRQRLIDAFTRAAAEHGYDQVTIGQIAASAGLPRDAFYEHFSSKHHCLVAAHDAFFERLIGQIEAACASEETWSAKVAVAITAGLEFLAETATRARVFAVDGMSAGPLHLERRFAHTARLADLLRCGREHYPGASALPELTEWILLNGVVSHVTAHLLAEEPIGLPGLGPELVEMVLTPYLGCSEARLVAGR